MSDDTFPLSRAELTPFIWRELKDIDSNSDCSIESYLYELATTVRASAAPDTALGAAPLAELYALPCISHYRYLQVPVRDCMEALRRFWWSVELDSACTEAMAHKAIDLALLIFIQDVRATDRQFLLDLRQLLNLCSPRLSAAAAPDQTATT